MPAPVPIPPSADAAPLDDAPPVPMLLHRRSARQLKKPQVNYPVEPSSDDDEPSSSRKSKVSKDDSSWSEDFSNGLFYDLFDCSRVSRLMLCKYYQQRSKDKSRSNVDPPLAMTTRQHDVSGNVPAHISCKSYRSPSIHLIRRVPCGRHRGAGDSRCQRSERC